MKKREFENILYGLFDTMNNIYAEYCKANDIEEKYIDICCEYKDNTGNNSNNGLLINNNWLHSSYDGTTKFSTTQD